MYSKHIWTWFHSISWTINVWKAVSGSNHRLLTIKIRKSFLKWLLIRILWKNWSQVLHLRFTAICKSRRVFWRNSSAVLKRRETQLMKQISEPISTFVWLVILLLQNPSCFSRFTRLRLEESTRAEQVQVLSALRPMSKGIHKLRSLCWKVGRLC